MRSTEFEHNLQLVTAPESNDSSSQTACDAADVHLPEEQMLSWAFGEIGAHIRQIAPSLEVEQRVMKAFDRELQKPRSRRKWPRHAAAIAAGLLVVAGVSFALLRHRSNSTAAVSTSPIELRAATATVEAPQVKWSTPVSPVKPKRSDSESRLARHIIHRETASTEVASEITTDFIRINAAPIEPGDQIVRVQLPRSAMAQFGLPVNMDRSDKPVKADVIMGIDGVAQAIRFVQ